MEPICRPLQYPSRSIRRVVARFNRQVLADDIQLASQVNLRVLVTADTLAQAGEVVWAIKEGTKSHSIRTTVIDCASVGDALGDLLNEKSDWIVLEGVGSLTPESQTVLLRFLTAERGTPSRVISTALPDLYSAVNEGRFPAALFYRLNTIHIRRE